VDRLPLPTSRRLGPAYRLSIVTAVLMTGVSAVGLLDSTAVYPTEELRRSFVANDVVNLLIGLPILLGSMWLARLEKLIGLLLWPGALFYILYTYIAYAAAMPFSLQAIVYVALSALSACLMITLLSSVDGTPVRQRITGTVHERLAGGMLVAFGALFFLRAVGQVAGAVAGQGSLAGPERGILVADLLTTPVWVIVGMLLWGRDVFGYVAGLGLLFQASMLFVGLLGFFALQPFVTAEPFRLEDFVVIFVMGWLCFVPFGLFARGVLNASEDLLLPGRRY